MRGVHTLLTRVATMKIGIIAVSGTHFAIDRAQNADTKRASDSASHASTSSRNPCTPLNYLSRTLIYVAQTPRLCLK